MIPLSDRLEHWRRRGRFFDGQPHRIFYLDEGAGPPLLLLHAYPTASWGFHRIWPELAKRFRVIAPDLPGSGFSEKPRRGPYDIATLADQVEALLEHLGVNQVHTLAHAYGVTTAQELLARQVAGENSLRHRSMCFVNGGLFVEGTHPTFTQKLLLSPFGGLITRCAPQPYGMFRRKLAPNFGPETQPTEREMRELWQLLRINQGHQAVPQVLRYLKERHEKRQRWVGALERTEIPLRLINGGADPVAGADVPRIWKRTLPGADLVDLGPRIGHYPPLEDPERTLGAFLGFIDDRFGAEPAEGVTAESS